MTELLFREDAYSRACRARIAAVDARGIRLDRTVFYPMGGEQPGDTDVLRLPSRQRVGRVSGA
jgi:misacylated tRNA(Ala) deacylase